jgi:hypothetical protein
MHTIPVARKVSLSALVALALLAGALFVATPKASASREQCTWGTVCAWSHLNFEGQFSWWWGSNTGCKAHEGNPNLRSFWNRTEWWDQIPGKGRSIAPWEILYVEPAVTGVICWP